MDDKHETPWVASMGWPIGLPNFVQLASIIPSSAWACEHGTRLPAGCWTFSIQSGLYPALPGLYPGWRMEFGSPSPRWTPKGDSVKGTAPKAVGHGVQCLHDSWKLLQLSAHVAVTLASAEVPKAPDVRMQPPKTMTVSMSTWSMSVWWQACQHGVMAMLSRHGVMAT